jgi:hypothetical protein
MDETQHDCESIVNEVDARIIIALTKTRPYNCENTYDQDRAVATGIGAEQWQAVGPACL